jgi:flagellar protein FlaG
MASDVANASIAGRNTAPAMSINNPGNRATAAPVVTTPKVSAPKPMETNYDAGKLRKSMEDTLKMLTEQVSSDTGLGFSVDKVANRTVVTVRNAQSGETVRQIPSEDFLKMARNIEELKGILYNKAV